MNALAQLGLERYMCKIVEIKLLSVGALRLYVIQSISTHNTFKRKQAQTNKKCNKI